MNEQVEPTPKKIHVRAVPWKTSTAEQVKGALGEIPSYLRRVRDLELAVRELFAEARKARAEMLDFVCLRFRRLLDLLSAEQGARLPPETVHALGTILDEVDELPAFRKLRERPRDIRDAVAVEKALADLGSSILRFNARWLTWTEQEAPLANVNRLIDNYNRYYRFEKQCAVRYIPLDRIDFTPRQPLTGADVLAELSLLPEW
jgi:hypothetical protein